MLPLKNGTKYKIKESFFKNWSIEMAYIMGYFYADGGMEDSPDIRGKYIRYTSSDLTLLQKVKKLMGLKHKLSKRSFKNSKPVYLLQIGSKTLYAEFTIFWTSSKQIIENEIFRDSSRAPETF